MPDRLHDFVCLFEFAFEFECVCVCECFRFVFFSFVLNMPCCSVDCSHQLIWFITYLFESARVDVYLFLFVSTECVLSWMCATVCVWVRFFLWFSRFCTIPWAQLCLNLKVSIVFGCVCELISDINQPIRRDLYSDVLHRPCFSPSLPSSS